MPHSKRKGNVRSVPPPMSTSSPLQPTLERFFPEFQNKQEGGTLSGEPGEADPLQGDETSLSPPGNLTPPCPALAAAKEVFRPSSGSGAGTSTGGEPTPQQETLRGKARIEPRGRPPEINLDLIWTMLNKMDQTLQRSSGEVNALNKKFEDLKCTVETVKSEMVNRVMPLQKEVDQIKEVQLVMVKERTEIQKKIEQIENFNRRLNLRILNFPRLLGVSPIDLFRRYLKENLKVPNEAIPPINKNFYLPNSSKKNKVECENIENGQNPINEEQKNLDLNNISAILEQTLDETTDRATLLVVFVFEQDLNSIMRLYFKNINTLFGGAKIQMFPDVTKSTQQRRKAFLALKARTLAIGGSFLLAYPCKCIVKLGLVKYVFLLPEQLQVFLDSKQQN